MTQVVTSYHADALNESKYLALKKTWRYYCLSLLFLLAALIRFINIRAPGDISREYTSAIIARAFFFDKNPGIEPWRQEIARITKERQPVLEPPITEYLVSIFYRLFDKEELWYARFLTTTFWLIGGIFLYKLAQYLLNKNGAIIATAYYLLIPSGILTSRSFQPDALMMMMFLISLYNIMRYFEDPSTQRLLIAALLFGMTLLIRPLVIFALYGVFSALIIFRLRSWRAFFNWNILIFFFFSLLLPAIYYGYEIFIAGQMHWKVSTILLFQLYLEKEYWQSWFLLGVYEVGPAALVAALLGFWLLKKELSKAFVIGFGIGYLIFGLVFTYHIHTHDYYHLQLLPMIAICIAPIIEIIFTTIYENGKRSWWVPALAASPIILFLVYKQVRNNLDAKVFEDPKIAQEIGELVQHSDRTVTISYHYGLPLEYYSEISGTFWPRSTNYWLLSSPGEHELTVEERLKNLGFIPEYFIITNFDEYTAFHQDLHTYLENKSSLLAKTENYMIYQACQQ